MSLLIMMDGKEYLSKFDLTPGKWRKKRECPQDRVTAINPERTFPLLSICSLRAELIRLDLNIHIL
jgi:hypothetical protein